MAQRKVSTSRLNEGMIIKRDVYSHSGVIIVPENTVVTKDVIALLIKHFIVDVIIDVTIPTQPAHPQRPKQNFSIITKQQMAEFQQNFEIAEDALSQSLLSISTHDEDIEVSHLLDSLNSIIKTADSDVKLYDMMSFMQKKAQSLYTHCINVAVFSQILAKWLDCSEEEIEMVSVASLLHDIGILRCIPSSTTPISFHDELSGKRYDRHVVYGYNLIKDKDIDPRVKQAVLTHHEHVDGTGFPLHIPSTKITHISKILAVADTYDTMTMRAPGDDIRSQFETIKYLEENSYGKLDSHILMVFLDKIAHTLIQHKVLLSNGQIGRVVMINKYNLSKPLIQTRSGFVDLSVRTDLTIAEVITEVEE